MKPLTTCLLVLASFVAFTSTAASQSATTETVTNEDLQRLRAETEQNSGLGEDTRTRILAVYDQAIAFLDDADRNQKAAVTFAEDRNGVDRLVSTLKAELERPGPDPALHLPENPTVEDAEDALARERARLNANLAALREEQQVADERSKTRSEIAKRLGELDLEIELLTRELRSQVDSAERSEFKLAGRMAILARRAAATTEIEMLRARLALLADRSALIPLNVDLAQRRVATSLELVRLHEQKAHELRSEYARTALDFVRESCEAMATALPQAAELARETTALAEMLWGTEGVMSLSEDTVRELASTRAHQAELNHMAELTARKFEVYGHRGSVMRWWPEIPEGFPDQATIEVRLRHLDEEIPEVEHTLITAEQDRARAHELQRDSLEALQNELDDGLTPEIEHQLRDLFAVRQDLLDQLIERGGKYSNQLVEYRTVLGNFHTQIEAINSFLYTHVLWSRSVPRPIIPKISDTAAALRWLMSPTHWDGIAIQPVIERRSFFAFLVLVFLFMIRRPLRRRLEEIADRTRDPSQDNARLTIEGLLITVVLAAPFPLLLYFMGISVARFGATEYWQASARAFTELATVAVLLESIRQVFSPFGLAELHFGWPASATRPLQKGLLAAELFGLPPLYVALHLAFMGIRINSSAELQLYNNTLGRFAFIVGLGALGLLILSMLRPERKTETTEADMRVPWPRRFAEYAFPTAFLGAYPIIIIATVVPTLLAVFGYYITALLLSYQMLRTMLLAFAVLVGGGLVHRWRTIQQNRLLLEAETDVEEMAAVREIETANRQVRQLFRFSAVVVLAMGLASIWSDALPMLQALKRVQLLPRVEILEPENTVATTLGIKEGTSPPARAPEDRPSQPETSGDTSSPDPTKITQASSASTSDDSRPLTLWKLLEAIFAGFATVVLARNLPGIVEILLKRRTTLDGGARFAFSTLVRYSITIFGSVLVFTLLGIGWSKVQWLAAALTFGLGFGLQEIVANFVSGLILLIERPVRVGDVVTIGTLMGRVSRIQIRATTITLWDRSEMVVPNKEFITTKLVNWTLSDSKRRIEIPLRVAYGADLEQVKALLIGAAEAHPLVLDDPAPQALLLTFGDDAINFELRFVVDFGNGIKAKDDVQMAIDHIFKENGIVFAVPQLKLQLPKNVISGDGPTMATDQT